MTSVPSEPSIDDVAYLARAPHRLSTLLALSDRPRRESSLWDIVEVSTSMMQATLKDFEERAWIQHRGNKYGVTSSGESIASAMVGLTDRLGTEQNIWQWLPSDVDGFTVGMFAEAVVTVAEPDDPYRPVNRFLSLLEKTGRFRFVGLDALIIDPWKDGLCQRVIDGMVAKLITRPRVVRYIRSTYPELLSQTFASGNLTVRVHDMVPSYGVCLFDEHISISGYDPANVSVPVLVDTDATTTWEWAETRYERYRREVPTLPIDSAERMPSDI